MPTLTDLNQLSQSHGLALALLLIATGALTYAVVSLHRKNEALWLKFEALLSERSKALDAYVAEVLRDRPRV